MDLTATLDRLAHDPAMNCDVAELALELARDEYSHLDVAGYLAELDAMAREARSYVRGNLENSLRGLCRYLFHEMGFRGNTQDYYDPRNSYLNQVLDHRTGIPISLSVVAMALGDRTGLQVAGIGLPGHFIAKAVAGAEEILFDPFHGGRILGAEQCEQLVARVAGVVFRATAESLQALPLPLLVQRLLTNLKAAYLRQGNFSKAARIIERLRQLRPDDWHERRDLGISLLHANQPGRALDHLAAYLNAFPDGADADTVRQHLQRARAELARLN